MGWAEPEPPPPQGQALVLHRDLPDGPDVAGPSPEIEDVAGPTLRPPRPAAAPLPPAHAARHLMAAVGVLPPPRPHLLAGRDAAVASAPPLPPARPRALVRAVLPPAAVRVRLDPVPDVPPLVVPAPPPSPTLTAQAMPAQLIVSAAAVALPPLSEPAASPAPVAAERPAVVAALAPLAVVEPERPAPEPASMAAPQQIVASAETRPVRMAMPPAFDVIGALMLQAPALAASQ